MAFLYSLYVCSCVLAVCEVWRKYRCHCFSSDSVCVCVRGGVGGGMVVLFLSMYSRWAALTSFCIFFFSRSPRPPTHAGALTWNLSRSLGLTLTLLALPLILLLYYRRSRQMLSLPFLVCLNALFFFLGFFCSFFFFFLNCSAVFTCNMSRSQLLSCWSVLFDFSFSAQSMCECQV